MARVLKVLLLGILLEGFLGWSIVYAHISIDAQVDKSILKRSDYLTYKIRISSDEAALPAVRLPEFKDFVVVSSQQASQINFKEGRANLTNEITILLAPLKEGRLAIPPATIKKNNKVYSTKEIEVVVLGSNSHQRNLPEAKNKGDFTNESNSPYPDFEEGWQLPQQEQGQQDKQESPQSSRQQDQEKGKRDQDKQSSQDRQQDKKDRSYPPFPIDENAPQYTL